VQNYRAHALCVGLFGLFACFSARADLWATNGSLAAPRGYHTATLLPNGKVLIAGGFTVDADYPNDVFLASAELYDPATGTCTNTGSMMVASTNLTFPLSNWTALGGITEIAPGQFQFSDPQATNSPQQFYQPFAS
jgi:hypothetical protein